MQTLGRADMTKLIVSFHNFANAPKKKCEFNVIHIPCNKLTIQYLIQQTAYFTIKNIYHSLILLLQFSAPTGHPWGGHATTVTNAVKDVQIWS